MEVQNKTNNDQEAWVVFSAQADLRWLKILKSGFRHCAVLLNDGDNWITVDPLSNYTDILVHKVPVDFDLPGWMCQRGHKVVKASIDKVPTPAPWSLFSCVEVVKRILGIHKRFIFTPWQLYRHLTKNAQNSKLKGDLAWEV